MRSLLLVTLVSCVASAQGFELERLQLNAGARETWLAQTGDGLEALRLRVSLLGHYQLRPLIYSVDGSAVGSYVANRWTAHLLGAFGITDWLEVGLQLPVVLSQRGDDLSKYGLLPVTSTALGAPWLHVRTTLLRQGEKFPLDLGISVAVSLPLGTAEALTKDPGVGVAFNPKLGLGYGFSVLRVGAEVGVLVRGSQVLSPASPTISDEVGSQFSGALVLSTRDLPVHAELMARLSAPFTTTGLSVEVLAAVRYAFLKQFEISLLGGPGIGKAPGTPALRVLLGFAWTPDFSPTTK